MARSRYITYVVGIAGAPFPDNSGPRPPDGHNLWPALTGANLTSPRTEVIHAVQNKYFNNNQGKCPTCKNNVGVAAARFGDYKIILNNDRPCDMNQGHVAWPTPAAKPVPFGLTTGWVLAGTNFAYAGLLNHSQHGNASRVASSGISPPVCKAGLPFHGSKGDGCCLESCGKCGCPGGTPNHCDKGVPKKRCQEGCCAEEIEAANRSCTTHPPPCVIAPPPDARPGCLFNVKTVNLSA
jgi:hypothetical protein